MSREWPISLFTLKGCSRGAPRGALAKGASSGALGVLKGVLYGCSKRCSTDAPRVLPGCSKGWSVLGLVQAVVAQTLPHCRASYPIVWLVDSALPNALYISQVKQNTQAPKSTSSNHNISATFTAAARFFQSRAAFTTFALATIDLRFGISASPKPTAFR